MVFVWQKRIHLINQFYCIFEFLFRMLYVSGIIAVYAISRSNNIIISKIALQTMMYVEQPIILKIIYIKPWDIR